MSGFEIALIAYGVIWFSGLVALKLLPETIKHKVWKW